MSATPTTTTRAAGLGAMPVFVPPWPDPAAALRAWSELQTQWGEQMGAGIGAQGSEPGTRAMRETLCGAMQLVEQGAQTTRVWLELASGNAAQISRLAHAAAGKAGGAKDVAALWDAEVEWVNQAVQATGQSMQRAWSALVDNQAQLAEAFISEGNRGFQRLLELASGAAVAAQPAQTAHLAQVDPASEAPVITVPNPWVEAMTQATQAAQAFWSAAAGEGGNGRAGAAPQAEAGTGTATETARRRTRRNPKERSRHVQEDSRAGGRQRAG